MIKANLLSTEIFPKVRIVLITCILPFVLLSLSNIFGIMAIDDRMLYPLLGLNVIGLIYFFSVFRKVRQNRIEIDSQEIRISNKKEVIQIIPKADIKEITFAESYNISRQNRDIMLRILLNKKNVDYIEIGHSNGKQRFDLEFDSSYMLTQFNKWRESWNEKLA